MAYTYEKANTYDSVTGRDNVEQKGVPAYLSAAGATQLKTGPGFLDLFTGSQGTGAVNIYDLVGTTASLANQIAQVPPSSLTIAATAYIAPVELQYHVQFNNGLYVNIVSTATVAAGTLSFS